METIEIDSITHRYYVSDGKIAVDEDGSDDFKCHLNFTQDQVPPHSCDPKYDRPSRQPILKTMNAMLNSKTGGTTYLGVSDDTTVRGLLLNQYRMDRIVQNVQDVMDRSTPRIPPHRYCVNFVDQL